MLNIGYTLTYSRIVKRNVYNIHLNKKTSVHYKLPNHKKGGKWLPFILIQWNLKNSLSQPKGHVGTRSFVLYREVSFIRRLKCTGIIGIGTSRFVLYREVSFIRSVLYRRFHCTHCYFGNTYINLNINDILRLV